MTVGAPIDPAAYEERYARYVFERAEEGRAVRVGEKEVSEQAAIVARYADLFTREQLAALRAAEDAAGSDEQERLVRLRMTCEGGVMSAAFSARSDELENALLAVRVKWGGESIPLRTAQALLATTEAYADRDRLGMLQLEASSAFNAERLALLTAREELDAELSGTDDPIARTDGEKGISLLGLRDALDGARARTTRAYEVNRERWFSRLLGPERDDVPASFHTGWMRRLSPLAATYGRERAVPVCVATLTRLGFDIENEKGIRLDLDDRPQKSPRACVIASNPPEVVHLITRAQGGLHDYEAFLHEAGHALHYAGCDPALPFAFRAVSRDHALTEIYSFLLAGIAHEPLWHAEHFGLSAPEAGANAGAARFVDTLLFRRYGAKLAFELDFWRRFGDDGGTPSGYEERLTEATGVRYRSDGYLSDMDAGFYSADYLRAWIRAAQVRQHLRSQVAEDWWRHPETGEFLRELFREGTRPTSEEIAQRLGFEPLDTQPLEDELALS